MDDMLSHQLSNSGAIPPSLDITGLLHLMEAGDKEAQEQFYNAIYSILKHRASILLRHERGNAPSPTALVHEMYLRLRPNERTWNNRKHFIRAAAWHMRNILVDFRRSEKRIDRTWQTLGVRADPHKEVDHIDMLDLDRALTSLAEGFPLAAEVIQLRYFGGARQKDIPHLLGITKHKADTELAFGKAWIKRELSDTGSQ